MSRERGLPKAEWVVMEALWKRGSGTATDIQRDLEAQQGWAYSTVKTMLDRLVEKKFVKARREGNVYEYSPKIRRESMVSRVIDDVVERVLEGSLSPFLTRLLSNRRPSREELAELREILDKFETDQEGPAKNAESQSDDRG